MFACPHCQFENPIENRFCQRCGNPLKCLRAIVIRTTDASTSARRQDDSPGCEESCEPAYASATKSSTTEVTLTDLLTADNYLDGEKRYQLRQPLENGQCVSEEVELAIIDCQPAAASPVALMFAAESAPFESTAIEDTLPPLAYPYWKLQDQFFPVIPELQAAWQAKSFTILVVEDRSHWQQLSTVWRSEAVEPLELIHWFYEMVNLWDSLVRAEAEPSLLSPQNLLIDDDQILCLQRLLYRPSDRTYNLKDLGLFWQSLLQQLPHDKLAALVTLAIDIGTGAVTETAAIKERLTHIADSLQDIADDLDEATTADLTPPPLSDQEDTAEFPKTSPPSSIAHQKEAASLLMDHELLSTDTSTDTLAATEVDSSTPEEGIGDLPTMALPMRLYRLDEVGRTHVGRQRTHNEDSFYAETGLQKTDSPSGPTLNARGLYILCDGMGGHAGGEVASTLAVETLRSYFETHWQKDLPDEETIKTGILQANQAIFDRNELEGRTGNARMGTTLVMVLLSGNQAIVAHVGDSRLYCFTRKGLKQATIDHEVGQREIKRGVEPAIAYARPDAYQLTQALGPRGNHEVAPNINTLHINQDTLLLLCSDGLSDNDLVENHSETHIKPLLRSRSDLDEGVSNLIELANEHNGHDNITAIAVRVKVRPNLDAVT